MKTSSTLSILVLLLLSLNSSGQAPTITSFSPTTAGEGDTVYITGTNFGVGNTYVDFGGDVVSNKVLSSTLIQAYIATGATGSVRVETDSGTASLAGFTYDSHPIILSVTPGSAKTGDSVIIRGKYLVFGAIGEPPTISFGGVSATSVTGVPGTGFSTVKAIVGNGASGIISLTTPFGTTTYPNFIFLGPCFPMGDSESVTVCPSQLPYKWNGSNYSSPGTYIVSLKSVGGCDSIAELKLSVNPVVTSLTDISICSNQLPFKWNGNSYNTAGTYNATLLSSFGCDSVATLNLTIHYSTNSSINTTVCSSQLPFAWNGTSYNAAGTYQVTFTNAFGCDSTATLNLTVLQSPTTPIVNSIINYQQNDTASALTATGTPGDSLLWYNVAVGGVASFTAPVPNTKNVGTTTYYVSQLKPGNPCESPRAAITVSVNGPFPTITSFSPASGPIGTAVTITGTNFSSTAANNIVYFGAVKATVTNATSTSLNVTVPAGTTYEPISVTVNALTAFSRPFDVTFVTLNDTSFISTSFEPKTDITTSTNPSCLYAVDLDGDGKPDIATGGLAYPSLSYLSLLKNAGSKNIGFKLPLNSGISSAENICVTDLDGDGSKDLIVSPALGAHAIYFYRNLSNGDSLSLAPRIDSSIHQSVFAAVGDLDGDGKPDIAWIDSGMTKIFILKNTSTPGVISFAPAIQISGVFVQSVIAINDIDGDGKPDLIVDGSFPSAVCVFRNTTVNDSISFSSPVKFSTGCAPTALAVADLNGDGRPDIAAVNCGVLSVLQNTSIPDSISFMPKTDYTNYSQQSFISNSNISVGDLDGDNKPDIVVANFYHNSVSVYKNITTSGNVLLQSQVIYPTGVDPSSVVISDVDLDGKPDILVSNSGSNTVSILRNKMGEPNKLNLCPPIANASLISNRLGNTYQWQLSTDSINFTNISNNTNYSGVTTETLHLQNIPSSWDGYQYRCFVNGVSYSDITSLKFADSWTGTVNSSWENTANWNCGTVPDSNTDVIIKSGTVVINSNVIIRSLSVSPGASFTVNPSFSLTVTH